MPFVGFNTVDTILGSTGSDPQVAVTARPGDYGSLILRYWSDIYPFIAMMRTSMSRTKATDPQRIFFQEDIPDITAYINTASTGYNSSATSIVVDDSISGNTANQANMFRKGTVLRVVGSSSNSTSDGSGTNSADTSKLMDGELLLVTADPTDGHTLTVSRGYMGTSAAAIPENTKLISIGDGQAEAGLSPTPVDVAPTSAYNYIEIFRDSWGLTAQTDWTMTRFGEPERTRKQRVALNIHAQKQEMSCFYGTRGEAYDSASSSYVRKMGGLAYFMLTDTYAAANNVHDGSSSNFSWTNYNKWFGNLWYGSGDKVVYMSQYVYNCFQALARDKLGVVQLVPGETMFGFRMATLQTDGPTIHLKVHPLLTKMASQDAFVVDMSYIAESYATDFLNEPLTIANTNELIKRQFRSERCFTFGNFRAHMIIRGITTYTSA